MNHHPKYHGKEKSTCKEGQEPRRLENLLTRAQIPRRWPMPGLLARQEKNNDLRGRYR